jgi:hypothetical protein
VLDLETNGIKATRIAVPPDALAVPPRHVAFSPSGDVLAWHVCATGTPASWQSTGSCTLWPYRISGRKTTQRVTPCPDSDLAIGWDENEPRAQRTQSGICLDADGKSKLPIATARWLAAVRSQIALCQRRDLR